MGLGKFVKRAVKKVGNVTKRTVGGVLDPLNITGHGGAHYLNNRGGPGMLGLKRMKYPQQTVLADQIRQLYPEPGNLQAPVQTAPLQVPQWPFQNTMEPPPPLPQANPMQQYKWNQLPQKQSYNPTPQLPKMKVPGMFGGM
jgi:hypothetical protein